VCGNRRAGAGVCEVGASEYGVYRAMKGETMKRAMWKVSVGLKESNENIIDNWRSEIVIADRAELAIKLATITKKEFLVGLEMIERET
jgi:hypothetical protein